MTTTQHERPPFFNAELIFQLFKYTVYILLSMNIYHFFVEDYAASSQTFANGISPSELINAFTATIDTLAWVVLLLLFELETYLLDDKHITPRVKWSLHSVRALCYVFIVYSFYGYINKYIMLHSLLPFSIDDACTLVGTSFSYVEDIDEYMPITVENCMALNNTTTVQIVGTEIISTQAHMIEAHRLSVTEVVNSANWLIIVAILEIDVYLQSKGKLFGRIAFGSKAIKVVLYSILFLAAAYWGYKGDFLDFWDAFLWLVAFIFIELNIFEWSAETREADEAASIAAKQ
ncbi:MAG: hypothetical protein V7711_11740 [Pseudomonadales bacterium]